jgi:acetyltransferase-like isoleucine patch superfamily enzyme
MGNYQKGAHPTVRSIVRLVREDGLYVLFVELTAYMRKRIRNFLLARKLGVRSLRIGSGATLRGLSFVKIGEGLSTEEGFWLEAISYYNGQLFSPQIVIGKQARMSRFVHIAATNKVSIGDYALFGSNVLITDHNHGQYSKTHISPDIPPALRPLDADREVTIGNNVWLGDSVVVTAGASIGDGVVIAANSVVIGHIPAYSLAAGAPATVRKTFDTHTRQWGLHE